MKVGSSVRGTLRGKLIRLTLGALLVAGISVLGLVAFTQVRDAETSLRMAERQIEQTLEDKGRLLADNQALALRSLASDNAFTAMNNLVASAVSQDSDVLYGLFLSAENEAYAYASPSASPKVIGEDGEQVWGAGANARAWKELHLAVEELHPRKPGITHKSLFGQQVLEVSAPVVAGDEFLGTIRYGISKSRMRRDLAQASVESRNQLHRTLGSLLLVLTLLTAAVAVFAVRSASAISRPVRALSDAAAQLAAGERGIVVDIRSGDELETLGHAFNRMTSQLKSSYGELEALNKTLEQRVAQRTQELEQRTEQMRLVLDHVDQGLVMIGANGKLLNECSLAFQRWFGEPGAGESPHVWEILGADDPAFRVALELGWEQLVDGFLPRELSLAQLPTALTRGGRQFNLAYKPLMRGDSVVATLLVVSDVTEHQALARAEQAQKETLSVFRRLMHDATGFSEFYDEASRLVEKICSGQQEVAISRSIHTLKGNCLLFGINTVASHCHALEQSIAESGTLPTEAQLSALKATWGDFAERISELTNTGKQAIVSVSLTELEGLIERAKRGIAPAQLAWELEQLKDEPMSSRWRRVAEQIEQLASRLGRCQVRIKVNHGDVRLPRERWAPFWSASAHIIRNLVDHGLSTATERKERGKDPCATVHLRSSVTDGVCTLEIQDDGCGVDWQRVRERAVASGLPAETQADLVEALFTDGFTTRVDATDTSGRGVGMSAVRQQVEAMAGQLEFESVLGVGTTVRIVAPVSGASSVVSRPGAGRSHLLV